MARYGDNHKGGPRTKAERMGLEGRMNDAFKSLTNGKDNIDGATEILTLMWQKAIDGDIKAIEWIAHRYYGKEPKAIIQDVNVNGGIDVADIKEFFGNSFGKSAD